MLGKGVPVRAQAARSAVTQQGSSVPPLAPGSSSGFFSGGVGGRHPWPSDAQSLSFRPGAAAREPPPQCPPLHLLETPALSTQTHLIKFWGRAEKRTGRPAVVCGHSSLYCACS